MTEDQIKLLVDSYGLKRIIEAMGLEEEKILDILIDLGYIDIEDLKKEYF